MHSCRKLAGCSHTEKRIQVPRHLRHSSVAGGRLFDLNEWTTKGERVDVVSFATDKTFWSATGDTIDLLIVGDAKVIGGQACAGTQFTTQFTCFTSTKVQALTPEELL